MFSFLKNNGISGDKCLIQKKIRHNLSSRFAIFASSVSILSKKYKQLKFILLCHNITISFIYTDWLMSLSLYLGNCMPMNLDHRRKLFAKYLRIFVPCWNTYSLHVESVLKRNKWWLQPMKKPGCIMIALSVKINNQ